MTTASAVQVALLGLPNTGKSTLYNKLTGGHAHVANWPGLTVELLRGSLPADAAGRPYDLIDLPGIHDLRGSSEDEAVVRRFLSATRPDLAVVVLNASHANTQLRLALELQATGLPLILALNMGDEAQRYGVRIDHQRLAADLGLPVLVISARRGEGLDTLLERIHGFDQLQPALTRLVPEAELEAHQARLVASCIEGHDQPNPDPQRDRLDRLLLHPLLGLLSFLVVMLAVFQLIYAVGGPIQSWLGTLFDAVEVKLLQPALQSLALPDFFSRLLSEGLWMGATTVISFMPIIFLFYMMIALIEDSGYLARSAFLMDGVMHWLGLDGRSFVLQIMGFGCNVPAIMGTRVIRERPQRWLAMLMIPFSLCQARLTVFVFMAGAFFPRPWWAAGAVIFGFYVVSFAAAVLTALLFKRVFPSQGGFVLELPPYRAPSLGTVFSRAWREMVTFFFTTRRFIILGVIAIWLLNNLPPGVDHLSGQSLAGQIGRLVQPLLGPIGMNPELTISLIFGFIAKEILLGAMAVIYATRESALASAVVGAIRPLQALSFMMFTLLYTPCLSTVAVQLRESRSGRFVALSLVWSFSLAWVMAFLTYQGGLRLGFG
ncbi:ferrous iron transport protein B [Synechococcus sp. EJ6-Ellesmere]|uniref:ferrous iron transport protein B n=1 Tax=Synechococcus sp. EJ6-Ellesmere TaxID=2823734 RepID=UPI0020CE968C|nr:ferrous iron transport protein B [Synechococcus sp. EJ6-Ellesmere]MCP9825525.1 ferrous iron transport protein B [Synechococcus sp. EJ6-Ellesmere]